MFNLFNGPENADGARIDLGNYLGPYGLDLDDYAAKIRDFFKASQEHFVRLIYRDIAAECDRLDMASDKDRDTLLDTIGSKVVKSRKVVIQWQSGEIDTPLGVLESYLMRSTCPGIESKMPMFRDLVGPMRTGIARALTYIRVFPPIDIETAEREMENPPEDLCQCWRILQRHAHYRLPNDKPRLDINQHALDSIQNKFGNRFWIEPTAIGEVMRSIDFDCNLDHPLFWEYYLFKFATFVDVPATHKGTTNEHRWIWDDNHPRFNANWGL